MHRLRRYDVFRFAQNDVAPLRAAMMRCLPLCARRHTSLGVAVIIGEANIICRRQTSFKKRTFVLEDKSAFFVMVGEAGFGPAKSVTTDLQSAPFGRSGIPPYIAGAGERSRTINLLITNQLLCH